MSPKALVDQATRAAASSAYESPGRRLKHFVALSLDRADGLDTRLANRPAHLDFLKANRERIRIGGPLLAPDGKRMIGSMLIVEAENEAEARALLEEDPYAKAELFQEVSVLAWRWVVNPPETQGG